LEGAGEERLRPQAGPGEIEESGLCPPARSCGGRGGSQVAKELLSEMDE